MVEVARPNARHNEPSKKNVTIHEAKTHLSRLLKEVEKGETVIIARGTTPIARLVPFEPKPRRKPGRYKGLFTIGPEFFEPLPDDELKAWEGE
ncbi:MAG: type II toxin-antitoxin system Phd/YefM family antitoxin [Pseudomonadota bacterium]|nr:type II toxin-antitoxin system Phd/YefM family antitoxin [Pseudomonadota bacterium]